MRYVLEVRIARSIEFDAENQGAADRWAEELMVSDPAYDSPGVLKWSDQESYARPRPVEELIS